jgi:hypothetical protein
VQPVAGDEAAVVVEEGDQVDATVLPLEHKGKQVGLPELIGPRPLEAAGGGIVTQVVGEVVGARAGVVQDAGDGGGAGRQGGAALEQIADTLAAPVGVGLLEQQGGAAGQFGQA